MNEMLHQQYMDLALELARRGEGRTAPNPPVGAVIVRNQRIVGRGFHPRAGEPHAEIFALREAGAETRGAVDLERGDAPAALAALKRALEAWRKLEAPHEVARVRVLRGRACRTVGDHDGAALELDAARAAFEKLGAAPAVAEIDALTRRGGGRNPHGLTPREREVLELVATGRTNRSVAESLSISEKTVARHVANIFRKIGVSSRAAATAYAYRHGLAGR